jgi:hypothetical protein
MSSARARTVAAVGFTMKPVGKPDAGNPHVRFDERGGETGLRHQLENRASPRLYVRLDGAHHLWRKVPSGELSIDPEADERLGRATGRVEAS